MYKTPIRAWEIARTGKREEMDEEAKARTADGDKHEPDNLFSFAKLWKVVLYESPFIYHRTYKRLRTTPDAYIKDDFIDGLPAVVEAKCMAKIPDYPPAYYLPQLYCEMDAYGVYKNYFLVWNKDKIRVWLVLWCDKMWNFIMLYLHRFWECLKADVPPIEEIIPCIGADMQHWFGRGYSELTRNNLTKLRQKTNPNFTLPPRPIFKKVYEAEGIFLPTENNFEVKKVIYSSRVRLKQICTGEIAPCDEFDVRLLEYAKKNITKVDLPLYTGK